VGFDVKSIWTYEKQAYILQNMVLAKDLLRALNILIILSSWLVNKSRNMFGVIARQPGYHWRVQDMPIVLQIGRGGLHAILGNQLLTRRKGNLTEKSTSHEALPNPSMIS